MVSIFPLYTLSFPPSFHAFLSSCLGISSFLSFAHTLVRPLAYTCARALNPGFRSPRLLCRSGSSGCPWSLGSVHRNHLHSPVSSPSHVFIRLSSARTHLHSLTLALVCFAPFYGGHVREPLGVIGIPLNMLQQGGKASSDEPCPTKLNRWRGSG